MKSKKLSLLLFALFLPACSLLPWAKKTLEELKADCAARPEYCVLCRAGERWDAQREVCVWYLGATPTPIVQPTEAQTPTPTPTPTATPEATPQPSPSPTAAPSLTPEPLPCVPEPSTEPVSIKQTPRCRKGFEPLDFLGDPTLCAVKAGEGNGRTAWRLGYGIDRQGMKLVDMRGALVQQEEGRGCTDAMGRFFPGCDRLYQHPEGASAPYSYGGYTVPQFCSTQPTPRPTAVPGAPTPTPFYPPMQPQDFRLNFVNGCQELHYKRNRNGEVCGECDGTYRFIGTLKNGERWGNACDLDHFICGDGLGRCPDAAPEVVEAHRKTWELCAGRDWDDPVRGVVLRVQGANSVEKNAENPYKHWICGPEGGQLEVQACAPQNPTTGDGLPIPTNGDACGPVKRMTF